ncbi:MAG: IS200/IS605 family transposase [Ignavibacteria bacterium]|nr:IS200/IS605 family transposase [Ignavibacteria bacterium]MBK7413505.1 IS200/IS605 family transposase [Ignavibacteria bacterium]
MPHSFDNVLLHIVFATKFREKILGDDIRSELHAYIGGIASNIGSVLLAAGSVSDHIHLLVSLPRTCTPAKLVQDIKAGSSKWIRSKGGRYACFSWQVGYSVFSVSAFDKKGLVRYIENQASHHARESFESEHRKLTVRHEIAVNEPNKWD